MASSTRVEATHDSATVHKRQRRVINPLHAAEGPRERVELPLERRERLRHELRLAARVHRGARPDDDDAADRVDDVEALVGRREERLDLVLGQQPVQLQRVACARRLDFRRRGILAPARARVAELLEEAYRVVEVARQLHARERLLVLRQELDLHVHLLEVDVP